MVSKKDQENYWYNKDIHYDYFSAEKFANVFKNFHVGKKLEEELSVPFNKSENKKNALAFSKYSLGKWELLKACTSREWLLMKRNSFVHVFKSAQVIMDSCVRNYNNIHALI